MIACIASATRDAVSEMLRDLSHADFLLVERERTNETSSRASSIASSSMPVDAPLALHVALLDVIPRISVAGEVVWADLRGLSDGTVVDRLTDIVIRSGMRHVTIGIAAIPIAAYVAAREATRTSLRNAAHVMLHALKKHPPSPPPVIPNVVQVVRVPSGTERAFLDPLLLRVLDPDPALGNLLDGAGFELCRDLARMSREPVEVRFGADGAALWRLARGDDDRHIFDVMPRALPESSMAWSEYAIKRVERLVFVLNGLCGSVCHALQERGEGAMAVTLRFSLANRTVFEHPVRAARPTSSHAVWMRILRLELERLTLPDAVVGITLRVDALGPLGDKQGDLFDRGFVTARAAEAGLSQVMDDQGEIVVLSRNTRHALVDRRTEWVPLDATRALEARPLDVHADPVLTLQVLPRPMRVMVTAEARRGALMPTMYRDGSATHAIVDVAGPDRVSGERWHRPYARDYYRCVTAEGQLVWLYHDALEHAWYLHGWWD